MATKKASTSKAAAPSKTAAKTAAKKATRTAKAAVKKAAAPTGPSTMGPTGQPAEGLVKPLEDVAAEVLKGKWGTGRDRDNALQAAGYNRDAVAKEVARQRVQQ